MNPLLRLALALMAIAWCSAVRADIGGAAVQQIQGLLQEKQSRTPAQRKINSQLLYAARMQRGVMIAAGVPRLEVDVGADREGGVIVDISADVDADLLDSLQRLGVEVIAAYPQYRNLRARTNLDHLEAIAALAPVHFIQPQRHAVVGGAPRAGFAAARSKLIPNGYVVTGAANAEGVITHGIYSARGTFNTDGSGVRIGVISNAVNNIAASQASGDLPPTCSSGAPPPSEQCVFVLPGQLGSGSDEGTAMLEVVHDIAPGAQLYFATGVTSIESFAANIGDLRNVYHCDIIVDDLSYFVESPFQDGQAPSVVSPANAGLVTQAVNDVIAAGVLYFSSAGNDGNKNDGTSSTWEGDFVDGGSVFVLPGGTLHDFDPGAGVAQGNAITPGYRGAPINLSWSDPLGASGNDYDLFVMNNALTAIFSGSTDVQNGTQDPYEQIEVQNVPNRKIVVFRNDGAANRFLHVSDNRGGLQFNTSGATHGHHGAPAGYAVAAVPAYSPFQLPIGGVFFNGPYPNLFSTSDKVETFSSDGPRRIFFDADGTPKTPGNFSASGGVVVQQPLISAADGNEVSGAGGFPSPFFGTSCAAPSAAAITALLLAANPALTPVQVKAALTSTALDIESVGVDQDAGYGIAMAYPALQAIGAPGKAFLEFSGVVASDSGGNGLIEPGETGTLSVNLKNTGLLTATAITAALTSSTPGVNVVNGSSAFTDLAAGGASGSGASAFTFQLANTASAIDRVVDFTLTVSYSGGWNAQQPIPFRVQTGRPPIHTTLDANAPPSSIGFPLTQTTTAARIVTPTYPPSSCGFEKEFPGTTTLGAAQTDVYTLLNTSGATTCAKVSVAADKTATDLLHAVAYLGSYDPADPSSHYLGDVGGLQVPGYAKTMAVNVPAGVSLVIVINETFASGAGTGTPYTLQVSGLGLTLPLFKDGFE